VFKSGARSQKPFPGEVREAEEVEGERLGGGGWRGGKDTVEDDEGGREGEAHNLTNYHRG
jgi:hypothetical protein